MAPSSPKRSRYAEGRAEARGRPNRVEPVPHGGVGGVYRRAKLALRLSAPVRARGRLPHPPRGVNRFAVWMRSARHRMPCPGRTWRAGRSFPTCAHSCEISHYDRRRGYNPFAKVSHATITHNTATKSQNHVQPLHPRRVVDIMWSSVHARLHCNQTTTLASMVDTRSICVDLFQCDVAIS